MVRKSIDNLCTCEDVKADKKDVVREEHAAAELVCNSASPKDVVPKITDVLDMTVTHISHTLKTIAVIRFLHPEKRKPEQVCT